MKKIKAYIINRNLLSSLKDTVVFLQKEKRIEIIIYDIQSTYIPLLEYYNSLKDIKIIYNDANVGPHSIWRLQEEFIEDNYIITDSDCDYSKVPNDWLNVLLTTIEQVEVNKVGFSLEINNLPNTIITKDVINHESQFWVNKNKFGWLSDIDTTFSLYRKGKGFCYSAIRLDRPYTIKHIPWYIKIPNEEWQYYIDNVSNVSTWWNIFKNK